MTQCAAVRGDPSIIAIILRGQPTRQLRRRLHGIIARWQQRFRPVRKRARWPQTGASRAIAYWLLVCCALVFAIVVVGGVTRLTHSGLSITEWQPIVGTLPPHVASRLGRRVRAVPGDTRIPAGEQGDGARRIQAHLLVGIRPSLAGPPDRRGVPGAVPVVPGATKNSAGAGLGARRHLRPRRTAGRARLVHGAKRARRRSARFAVPADRASGSRVPHLRRDALDRVIAARGLARRARGAAQAAPFFVHDRGSRIRHGAHRRPRRGNSRGLRIQHVPVDERTRRAAGNHAACALVEELLLQHGHRAVRSSAARVDACVRWCRCCGGTCTGPVASRRARAPAPACWSRCSPCRSGSAS